VRPVLVMTTLVSVNSPLTRPGRRTTIELSSSEMRSTLFPDTAKPVSPSRTLKFALSSSIVSVEPHALIFRGSGGGWVSFAAAVVPLSIRAALVSARRSCQVSSECVVRPSAMAQATFRLSLGTGQRVTSGLGRHCRVCLLGTGTTRVSQAGCRF